MPHAYEVINGQATSAVGSAVSETPGTGDSFTVRNASLQAGVFLENVWGSGATAFTTRVRSPKLHDVSQGIRVKHRASDPAPHLPWRTPQKLYPQDLLTVETIGGAVEVDATGLLIYYTDLPGQNARLHLWEEIVASIANVTTIEVTAVATAAAYGATVALNSSFDVLKANTDYAILGFLTDVNVNTVGIKGPDTGNLRVGGPGATNAVDTREWFAWLGWATGRPHIPIVNSANKAGTFIDVFNHIAAAAVVVELIVAELVPGTY